MSQQTDLTGAGSSLHRPVRLQRVESPHDITIDADVPQPAGGVLALLDKAYAGRSAGVPGRRGVRELLLLTRQRHLLEISRHFVWCRMSLQSFTSSARKRSQRGHQTPSDITDMCRRLREVTSHRGALLRRLRGDPCLRPASPALREASRDMPRLLLVMSVEAVLLTEELILSVLQRAAHLPDLSLAIALYNQVVAELATPAAALSELRPFTISRTLEILSEERGGALAEKLCCSLAESGLVDVMRGHALTPAQSPPPLSQSCDSLLNLIQEERSQVTPALQALAGLDGRSVSESSLYERYSALLWTVLYSHVFHAFYPGRRHRALPALTPLPESACASAITFLQQRLASESLPEPGATLGRSLCERLLYTQGAVAWDRAVCRALSSALTDKCAFYPLDSDDSAPQTHSRTAGLLLSACQHLSRSAPPPSPCDSASLLARSTASLQMCGAWLRGRSHLYVSSGSLPPLVLITHGDLPVLKAECRSLVAALENAEWLPLTQPLWMKMQSSRDVLEGLLLSLPHVLGSVCSNRAQELFQQTMPAGRHWRARTGTGVDAGVSEYAQAVLGAVVQPVLVGVRWVSEEERVPAVSASLSAFMEAWMSHILRERLTFSLQGALQLKRDFESVRDLLRSREAALSPEVVQAALSLPVFVQADNAVVCLLQQPSRKAYLQPGSCALFWCCPPMCQVAVESVSDSLQSLESLERGAWQRGGSERLPRHSHDSYLPHNQRQWLSRRLHKRGPSLSLPWAGARGAPEG